MTLTLTQITNRSGDLSGEIKAATTALNDCEAAEHEQNRLASIASQATDRARARLDELKAERADLAEQARDAILAKGEPPPLADETQNFPIEVVETPEPLSIFAAADTADTLAERLMARSEENMNGAYDEATR